MPLEDPSLTVDTTSTDGTGTYTLDDPASPGGGLRTLADAVADGDVADTDTVEYMVVDTTTEGAALNFERGIGTVGGSGTTLTRDTIRQSSNGGAAVSWPGGGSRTVRVSLDPLGVCRTANNLSDVLDADAAADNIGAARLNADNVFTSNIQEVRSAVASQWRLNRTDVVQEWNMFIGGTGALGFRDLTATVTALAFDSGGSGEAVLDTGFDLVHGTGGDKFDHFPSGTRVLFGGTIPTGWTRDDANASRIIRLAKSGDTIGATGGVDDIFSSWATLGHTLTEAEMPSHNHSITVYSGSPVGGFTHVPSTPDNTSAGTQQTSTEGSDDPHSHNMSTPYYEIAAWATKD